MTFKFLWLSTAVGMVIVLCSADKLWVQLTWMAGLLLANAWYTLDIISKANDRFVDRWIKQGVSNEEHKSLVRTALLDLTILTIGMNVVTILGACACAWAWKGHL